MRYPALDVRGADPDLALAIADDFSPSAVEDLTDGVSIFFRSADDRARAHEALRQAFPDAALSPREVDDEDWARRSQENLAPITVGRVTVLPPWAREASPVTVPGGAATALEPAVSLVIAPSMGFGTGHHATTRLCLAALQTIPLEGRSVLDVGTGSGVLAIAARLLGASSALGIDVDEDAVASARENLAFNPGVDAVSFDVADLQSNTVPKSDVVLANLTGATLAQHARQLAGYSQPGGVLIVSGLLEDEHDVVVAAFEALPLRWSEREAGWVGLAFAT